MAGFFIVGFFLELCYTVFESIETCGVDCFGELHEKSAGGEAYESKSF